MHRKNLIITLILSALIICNCGGGNNNIETSPDNSIIEESEKKPWWKFWAKKTKKVPKNNNINNQIESAEVNVDDNLDDILAEIHMKINNLKSELNYYHDDLNEIKVQTKVWTNPFAVYNKEIVLDNGTSIFGKIIFQDQDILKVETLIGQLIIDRNTIVRVVNQVNSYNKLNDDIEPSDSQEKSGNALINKSSQSKSAHLVLVGDISEIKDASGNTVLNGEVKNVGNKRADFSKIIFTFRMNWGGDTKTLVQFINGVTNTFTTGFSSDNSILPHAVGDFELIIPESFGKFIGYSYEIEWDQDYKYEIEWDQYEK